MKRIIASILAAGAGTLALAGTANAAERYQPQVQKVDYDGYRMREHERFEREQARRRYLEHLKVERLERLRARGYDHDRW